MRPAVMSLAGDALIVRGDVVAVADRIERGVVRGVIGLGLRCRRILGTRCPAGEEDEAVPVSVDVRRAPVGPPR